LVIKITIPLHVTGFWKPIYAKTPLYTGSIGAGINLSECLTVYAEKSSENTLFYNEKKIHFPTIDYVFNKIPCRIKVRAYSKGVLGAGYGLSGALALGVSIAGLILCKEKTTLEEAASRAHVAEVLASTGLGDVIAEYYGGFEARIRPGPPGIGMVVKLPVDPSVRIVAISLGTYETRAMLQQYGPKHGLLASSYLDQLLKNPDILYFMELSRSFTKQLFDYSLAEKTISPIRRLILDYYLKKRVLVLLVEKDRVNDITDYLEKNNIGYIVSRVKYSGVEIEY